MTCASTDTICVILSLAGNSAIMATGGSLVLLGIGIILIIAVFCWRFNLKLPATFFFSFMAMSALRIYANDSTFSDIGLFGTLHNIMLLGVALVMVKVVVQEMS